MVYQLISVKIDEKWMRKKRHLEISWRYLIGKGLIHVEECASREAEMASSYQAILRSRYNARCMNHLRLNYPKIYDRILIEVSNVR